MTTLPSVLLTVAYDGTAFHGWQAQPALRTVEGVLSHAVLQMNGAPLRIRGASRTDAGVHALGQRVAFDPTKEVDAQGWLRGLNLRLPDDVRVRSVDHRPFGFEPRFRASHKGYRYLLSLGPAVDPTWRHKVWHLDGRGARPALGRARRSGVQEDWLDVPRMREAANRFVGTFDFRAFQASNDPRESTVRTLTRVEVIGRFANNPELLAIEVDGTAFLKNMVRVIVGTLLDVGRERRTPDDVTALLTTTMDRRRAGVTAPASGLTLVWVELNRPKRPQMS